jgi:quercetin dioxygenase-like cupin family protein
VLAGRAEVTAGGESALLEVGDTVVIPAEVWHGFTNAGDETLHVCAVFPVAAPTVVYEAEPGRVLRIGADSAEHRTPSRP